MGGYRNRNRPSLVRIFKGIIDKVVDDHADFLSVAPGHHMLVGEQELVADVALLGMNAVFLPEHLQHFVEVGVGHVHLHLSVLHLAEVENLVHQLEHLLGVVVDEGQVFLSRRRQTLVLLQFLNRTFDEGERCAQFMTDIGEETDFEFGQTVVHIGLVAHLNHIEHQSECPIEQGEQQQRVDDVGPPRSPPWRQNPDFKHPLGRIMA